MIPNRFAAGHHAVSCLEQLAILEETASKTNSKSFAGKEIGNLIIVDRSLDWATLLLRYTAYAYIRTIILYADSNFWLKIIYMSQREIKDWEQI